MAPISPVEKALAGIWSEVLGFEYVGTHDNFFELGGHSPAGYPGHLTGGSHSLQVKLPLRCLFETPTVAGLAIAIVVALAEETDPALMSVLAGDLESPTNT